MSSDNSRSIFMANVLLAAVAAGCGSPVMAPDGGRDGGHENDAAPSDAGSDARVDAAPAIDAGPPGCLSPTITGTATTDTLTDPLGTATVTIDDRAACLRTYTISSTATRRDALPGSPRVVVEQEGAPSIRTGNDLFDALYALTIEEARENSVEAISDYAFDDGRPIDCGGCYETGRLWNYVWTRDTAYSVALGLGMYDAERARHSLEFKLSERRGGGGLEIVQDTGSGGSWPVSTDRVAWAMGAEELLRTLAEPDRTAFRDLALRALRNTIERDRRVVFDAEGGLYRGEQSFLDWREQTYPSWVEGDVVHIAMSRSLSTNVLHLRAIELAATLADETGDAASAARWHGWATDLRAAIHAAFWDPDAGLFSTFRTTELDTSAVRHWDLLGQALAILSGIATPAEAQQILAAYPHVGPGAAPVIFPEQQLTRIYHNRAEWPFVTAFWLRAAREAGNDAVGDRAAHALMRGTALFLSNLENMETTTGAAFVDDGAYSGPVVSSQRQLWSVAGYLSMVQQTIFGLETSEEGLRVRPWITRAMRHELFANAGEIALRSVAWRGHSLDVVVRFPDAGDEDGYSVASVTLDGVIVGDRAITATELGDRSRIEVVLSAGASGASEITELTDVSDYRVLYAPRTPGIASLTVEGGQVRVGFDLGGEAAADVRFAVYRDGARVADALAGTTASYLDEATDAATTTHCWAVETCFVSSGNCSQHSAPGCYWGASTARITTLGASSFVATGGDPITDHGYFHYQAWGDPGDRLDVDGFTAPASGRYFLQVLYGNGGPVDSGITCGVKRIVVEDTATGDIVGSGVLVMPHLGTWDRWEDSSLVPVDLLGGHHYRFTIEGDDDSVNMSVFQHFASYTAGVGGRDGAFSRVNIAELRVLEMGP
jgi:hypothetical protein